MTRTILSLLLAALACLSGSCSSVWNTTTSGPKFTSGLMRVGGEAGASYRTNDFNGSKTNTTDVSADVGRFFGEHMELGLRLAYGKTEIGNANTDQSDYAVYGRWYTDGEDATRPFIELGGGASSVDDGVVSVTGSVFFLALGLVHFLNEHVSGDVIVRETIGSYDNGIDGDSVDVGVGFSFFW